MTDTQKTINCPACGKEMTKIFIADKSLNIDVCDKGCGGIYLDNREIREFNDPYENIEELKEILENKNSIQVDENKTRICPACQTPMTKSKIKGIQIDTCYNCGGIFLDNGEFQQVRSHFKKREQIQPINMDTKNGISLRDFCEADDDKFIQNAGFNKLKQIFKLFY